MRIHVQERYSCLRKIIKTNRRATVLKVAGSCKIGDFYPKMRKMSATLYEHGVTVIAVYGLIFNRKSPKNNSHRVL